MGVSVLSSLAVAEDVAAGRLLSFDLEAGGVWRKLYLVVPRSAPYHPTRDAFLQFVCTHSKPVID